MYATRILLIVVTVLLGGCQTTSGDSRQSNPYLFIDDGDPNSSGEGSVGSEGS